MDSNHELRLESFLVNQSITDQSIIDQSSDQSPPSSPFALASAIAQEAIRVGLTESSNELPFELSLKSSPEPDNQYENQYPNVIELNSIELDFDQNSQNDLNQNFEVGTNRDFLNMDLKPTSRIENLNFDASNEGFQDGLKSSEILTPASPDSGAIPINFQLAGNAKEFPEISHHEMARTPMIQSPGDEFESVTQELPQHFELNNHDFGQEGLDGSDIPKGGDYFGTPSPIEENKSIKNVLEESSYGSYIDQTINNQSIITGITSDGNLIIGGCRKKDTTSVKSDFNLINIYANEITSRVFDSEGDKAECFQFSRETSGAYAPSLNIIGGVTESGEIIINGLMGIADVIEWDFEEFEIKNEIANYQPSETYISEYNNSEEDELATETQKNTEYLDQLFSPIENNVQTLSSPIESPTFDHKNDFHFESERTESPNSDPEESDMINKLTSVAPNDFTDTKMCDTVSSPIDLKEQESNDFFYFPDKVMYFSDELGLQETETVSSPIEKTSDDNNDFSFYKSDCFTKLNEQGKVEIQQTVSSPFENRLPENDLEDFRNESPNSPSSEPDEWTKEKQTNSHNDFMMVSEQDGLDVSDTISSPVDRHPDYDFTETPSAHQGNNRRESFDRKFSEFFDGQEDLVSPNMTNQEPCPASVIDKSFDSKKRVSFQEETQLICPDSINDDQSPDTSTKSVAGSTVLAPEPENVEDAATKFGRNELSRFSTERVSEDLFEGSGTLADKQNYENGNNLCQTVIEPTPTETSPISLRESSKEPLVDEVTITPIEVLNEPILPDDPTSQREKILDQPESEVNKFDSTLEDLEADSYSNHESTQPSTPLLPKESNFDEKIDKSSSASKIVEGSENEEPLLSAENGGEETIEGNQMNIRGGQGTTQGATAVSELPTANKSPIRIAQRLRRLCSVL